MNETKAMKTMCLTIGAFVICWGPISAFLVSVAFSSQQNDMGDVHWKNNYVPVDWIMLLAYTNSGMNFCIFSIKNELFRKALKSFFTCCQRNVSVRPIQIDPRADNKKGISHM